MCSRISCLKIAPYSALLCLCVLSCLTPSPAIAVTENAKITPDDFAYGDRFGASVAIDGDTIVVGAPYKDAVDSASGAVYVFTRSGGLWTQQAKLTASDATQNDGFGISVAISGDTIVIGMDQNFNAYEGEYAPGFDNNFGAAYVFTRSSSLWTQQQKLLPSDAATGDLFGNSVSIDGDTILVGAPNNLNSGAAYFFTRNAGVWTQQQKITPDDANPGQRFGGSVSFSGSRALIGAVDTPIQIGWEGQVEFQQDGSAYFFEYTGATWTQVKKLIYDGQADVDHFGSSVAMKDANAMIGSPLNRLGDTETGAAYVYLYSNGDWEQHFVSGSTPSSYSRSYGSSVSIGLNTAVVGDHFSSRFASYAGRALVYFTDDGVCWFQILELSASDAAVYDFFGKSVAISANTVVVGAPQNTHNNSSNAGAAYVFDFVPTLPGAEGEGEGEPPACTTPDTAPVDLCDYWPLAVGNWWGGTETNPWLEVTAHYVINGHNVWKMHNNQTTLSTLLATLPPPPPNDQYWVYLEDGLYSTYDFNDLINLPTIPPGLKFVFPRTISDGFANANDCEIFRVGAIQDVGYSCARPPIYARLGLCPDYPVIMLDFSPCGISLGPIIFAKDLGIIWIFSSEESYNIVGLCDTSLPPSNGVHSADTSENFVIDLPELLRVIQFFNLGPFHCDPATEDGFNPGIGDQICTPHTGDYNTQDWSINLGELLRMIQIFNMQTYFFCPQDNTDDGFCVTAPT